MMPIQATGVTALFQVFDMRKSAAWYCDVLGFELKQKHEPDGHLYWAMLNLGDAVLMLNSKCEDDKRPPAPPRALGHSDVTLYFSCPNVDEAYEHTRAKLPDLKPPKVASYGITIADPDGFDLCFQQPAE